MSTSRKIIKNMAWMSVAELATKGMSFFTNAYLARVILEEGFGYVNYGLATMLYFTTLVTLGLNAIGSREIARNPDEITKYVNSIISIRILLAVLAFAVLAVFIYSAGFSEKQNIVLIIASVNIISSAFLIDWYFQGIERMDILGLRQIFLAGINLIGILVFVRNPDDIINAMIVLSGATLFNTIWILVLYVKWNGKITFDFDKVFWVELFKASIPLAVSLFCITILSNMSIIMLGLLLPNPEIKVGLFTSAIKIAVLLIMPISIIQSAFYPHFSRSESIESRKKAFDKYLLLLLVVGIFATSIVYFFPEFFIKFIYGGRYLVSADTLRLLMIWVAISYFSMTVMHPLIAWKKEKTVLYIVLIAAVFNIILNFIFIPKYEMIGAAITNITTEIFMAILFVVSAVRLIKSYPFINAVKVTAIAIICSKFGHLVFKFTGIEIVGILFAVSIYIIIIFGFKIITLKEIKGYLKR